MRTATTSKNSIDENKLAPHGDLYRQLEKIIDHLPDSAGGKARFILHRWDGIETQKDIMNRSTCNITCVCCVTVD